MLLITAFGPLATAEDLNGARGKIFKVDLPARSFELLKETVLDPQTNEGKSRHTVHWTEQTQFTKIDLQNDFKGLSGPVVVQFEMLNATQADAAAQGKPFVFKMAKVLTQAKSASGMAKDRSNLIAWFTPDPNPEQVRSGTIKINGKPVKVSLSRRRNQIRIYSLTTANDLGSGFWKTTVQGRESDGKFILDSAEIHPLLDPRSVDDPKLPRVLVVGDSISMNYHQAAKKALAGMANYYRVQGNGGPSDRGVSAMELWLGDYAEKGLHWDVIQFNHGLHDLKQAYDEKNDSWGKHQVAIEDYKNNLEKEIAIMKKTGATLIWCETTPVPNNSRGPYARRKGEAAVYNKAAMEVISKYPEILVNKLHQTISESKSMEKWRQGSDVHFWSSELQSVLGDAVAGAVIRAIESRESSKK
ncbi:MAG: SGNH/GDSL hydrolase family protein [Verrucomicrobiae bacterium]|nr:SGNH/GDSL hydrolase family protein [Verrucomicrobiae bacterium]NNJ42391.1 SGNH/GDSL hydrolase family protein [Akkermansiaceae bacterium]